MPRGRVNSVGQDRHDPGGHVERLELFASCAHNLDHNEPGGHAQSIEHDLRHGHVFFNWRQFVTTPYSTPAATHGACTAPSQRHRHRCLYSPSQP